MTLQVFFITCIKNEPNFYNAGINGLTEGHRVEFYEGLNEVDPRTYFKNIGYSYRPDLITKSVIGPLDFSPLRTMWA